MRDKERESEKKMRDKEIESEKKMRDKERESVRKKEEMKEKKDERTHHQLKIFRSLSLHPSSNLKMAMKWV